MGRQMEGILQRMFEHFIETPPIDLVRMLVMWVLGGVLIYLAIKRDMEPALLLPMGFGAILVNLPYSGALGEFISGRLAENPEGPLSVLYNAGIANELFPLLLFIGIGAMMDFGPLLSNPRLLIFGAAAQVGIFVTILLASVVGPLLPVAPGDVPFAIQDAAAIGAIGTADGPTSIFLANYYGTKYVGAIMVAAYSYMALVPIIQPPCVKLVTTKKERLIRMPYARESVPKAVRILFPIVVTIIAGLVAPLSVGLVGFLMFGNLIRECGVLGSMSETAQNALANLITILLGITIAVRMQASEFITWQTLLILALGLCAFIFNTIGGVLFAKLINLFSKKKINPMIGACGISAFPMSSRVIHKMGLAEDNQNFLLMHAAGVNAGGQIASVIAGGMILSLVAAERIIG